VVFRRAPGSAARPGAGYAASAALLRLAVTVGLTDVATLCWQLGDGLALPDTDRRRLHARGLLLTRKPPRVAQVAAGLAPLPATRRGAAADLLILLAGAGGGGQLGPLEMSLLGRIFHLLSLDEQDLARRLAALDPSAFDGTAVRRRAAESVDVAAMLLSPAPAGRFSSPETQAS
jgi:hypothetical protein